MSPFSQATFSQATMSSRAAAQPHWLLWHKAMDLAETVLRCTGACSTAERLGLARAVRQTALELPSLVTACPPVATEELLADLRRAARLAEWLEAAMLLVDRLSAEPAVASHPMHERLNDFQHLLLILLNTLQPSERANRNVLRSRPM